MTEGERTVHSRSRGQWMTRGYCLGILFEHRSKLACIALHGIYTGLFWLTLTLTLASGLQGHTFGCYAVVDSFSDLTVMSLERSLERSHRGQTEVTGLL